MIIIAHRGLLYGPDPAGFYQNKPEQIKEALDKGFHAEVDVWVFEKFSPEVFSGHDRAEHNLPLEWIIDNRDKLWLHCKSIDALYFLSKVEPKLNYFFHVSDDVTLTSYGYIWTFPGKQVVKSAIWVLPENNKSYSRPSLNNCAGICTDYPVEFAKYL